MRFVTYVAGSINYNVYHIESGYVRYSFSRSNDSFVFFFLVQNLLLFSNHANETKGIFKNTKNTFKKQPTFDFGEGGTASRW